MGSQQSIVSKQVNASKGNNLMHCSLNTLLANNGILPKPTFFEAVIAAYENNLIKLDMYAYLLHEKRLWID